MALEGSLDLFVLLVDYVAGGVLLSIFLWAGVLLITGIMGKMSMQSILVIILTFFAVAMVGYFGALFTVFLFLSALAYFLWGIYKKWL